MRWTDPTGFPETRGKAARCLLNPHGEPAGEPQAHRRACAWSTEAAPC
ncbi:hypothetical protein [Burkholderia glumae]|nr:hypothetical protein [Burkholderia glumae]